MPKPKSCLLIDDDHDDQLVFSIAIRGLNKPIICVTADNGFIALKKLEQDPPFRPDLIFLDLNLPGINGIDCLIRIKSNPEIAHIPVVIFTTSSRDDDKIKAIEHGAVDFITKPHHIFELTVKLNEFF